MAQKDRLTELEAAVDQASKTLDKLGKTSEKLVRSNSGVLISISGGLLGFLIAYVASLLFSFVSLSILGPLLLMLGLVAGALMFIGPERIKQDRRNEIMRSKNAFILEQIKDLPRNAPTSFKTALWLQYARNLSAFYSEDIKIIDAAYTELPSPDHQAGPQAASAQDEGPQDNV